MMANRKSRIDWISLASCSLAATVYLNSLKAGFVYDDSRAILSNQDILPTSPWTDMWRNDFWGTSLTHSGSHKSFRPLTTLSFRLNHYFAGFSPWPYHVTNVLLHTLTTWLFVRVARIIFHPALYHSRRSGGVPTGGSGQGGRRRAGAILVSALLFACHPIHTEAVAGIVGRADVGSTALALTAFLAYVNHVNYRDKAQRPGRGQAKTSADRSPSNAAACTKQSPRVTTIQLKSLGALATSIFLAGAAMLTKEQGLTILMVCATYDLIRSIIRTRHYQERFSIWKMECCSSVIILALSFLTLFHLRMAVMGGYAESPKFSKADNPTTHHPNFWTRLATFLFLPVFNAALLAYPYRLSYDWSMDAIPRVSSFTDPRNFLTLLFFAFLGRRILCSLLKLNKSSEHTPRHTPVRAKKKALCSLCWYSALTHGKSSNNNSLLCAPVFDGLPSGQHSSTLPHPVMRKGVNGCGVNARLKYQGNLKNQVQPPTVFDCCLATMETQHGALLLQLAFLLLPFLPASNLFFYVGFVVAERVLYMPSVGFCLLVGHGALHLWSQTDRLVHGRKLKMVLASTAFLCLLTLSVRTIRRNEDWLNEEKLYRAGIDINPPKSWGNLGNVLNNQGRTSEAEVAYRQALRFRSNMADVHYNLGLLLEGQGRLEEALSSYRSAVHFRPRLAPAYVSTGQVLTRLGRTTEAMGVYERCFQLVDEGVSDLRTHIEAKVTALLRFGKLLVEEDDDPRAAIKIYRQAVNLMPPNYSQAQSVYNAMGEALYRTGEASEAEEWFKEALKKKPDHIPAHLTYGKMLARNKTRLLEAESWFRRAKKIAPTDSSVYHHYGQFLAIQGRHAEAAEAYVTAAGLTPTDYDIIVGAANALRQVGDNLQAELYYEKAVALRPQESRAHMNLGAILHVNGKYSEAEGSYLAALELKPTDDVTLLNLKKLRQLQSRLHQSTTTTCAPPSNNAKT